MVERDNAFLPEEPLRSQVRSHWFKNVVLPNAACQKADSRLFDSHVANMPGYSTFSLSNIEQICGPCPVKDACLVVALLGDPKKDAGIWGGETRSSRNKLRRNSTIIFERVKDKYGIPTPPERQHLPPREVIIEKLIDKIARIICPTSVEAQACSEQLLAFSREHAEVPLEVFIGKGSKPDFLRRYRLLSIIYTELVIKRNKSVSTAMLKDTLREKFPEEYVNKTSLKINTGNIIRALQDTNIIRYRTSAKTAPNFYSSREIGERPTKMPRGPQVQSVLSFLDQYPGEQSTPKISKGTGISDRAYIKEILNKLIVKGYVEKRKGTVYDLSEINLTPQQEAVIAQYLAVINRFAELAEVEMITCLSTMGNSEIKALAILVMEVGTQYTVGDVARKIREKQGTGLIYDIGSLSMLSSWFSLFSSRNLLLKISTPMKEDKYEKPPERASFINAVAGHMLAFSEDHPDISLRGLIGNYNNNARLRYHILSELADLNGGSSLRLIDIAQRLIVKYPNEYGDKTKEQVFNSVGVCAFSLREEHLVSYKTAAEKQEEYISGKQYSELSLTPAQYDAVNTYRSFFYGLKDEKMQIIQEGEQKARGIIDNPQRINSLFKKYRENSPHTRETALRITEERIYMFLSQTPHSTSRDIQRALQELYDQRISTNMLSSVMIALQKKRMVIPANAKTNPFRWIICEES